MSVVRPEFGPTLPALLGPRWRALPRAVRAVAVVAVVIIAALILRSVLAGDKEDTAVVIRQPIALNFIYRPPLQRLAPGAGDLAVVGVAGGQRLAVRELQLPAYRGDAAGFLPLYSSILEQRMSTEFDDFLVRQEGRVNINKIQGYEIVFQFRRAGKLNYGRRVLLLPTVTSRQGADLLLTSPRIVPSVPTAQTLGRNGALKVPLRSMRFGTERP